MSTHSLRELRGRLGAVVRAVTATGEEAIITDSGTEIAVIVSMADYERLHEHADVVDALRLREMQATRFKAMTLAEMLEELGVDAGAFVAG
jgi:antitoxin YefM